MYAFKDKPIVAWSDRPRQRVYESDLRANYYMLKPYLLVCGNKTPLPDLVHHEVCGFHDVRMYRFKISILNNYIYELPLPTSGGFCAHQLHLQPPCNTPWPQRRTRIAESHLPATISLVLTQSNLYDWSWLSCHVRSQYWIRTWNMLHYIYVSTLWLFNIRIILNICVQVFSLEIIQVWATKRTESRSGQAVRLCAFGAWQRIVFTLRKGQMPAGLSGCFGIKFGWGGFEIGICRVCWTSKCWF